MKAQKYLLDNDCGDLILNDRKETQPKDRIYASDIMENFSNEQNKELIKDYKYCPYCGDKLEPKIYTDATSPLVCNSLFCKKI